jgi:hypothetical protein
MPCHYLSRPPATHSLIRFARAFALVLLTAAALNGCAIYSPPTTSAKVRDLPDATAKTVIATWQARLGQHIASAGDGDPAVLAQLPGLRSPAVARPGQIVFAATDVEAHATERDGYDVFGLLLGKQVTAAGPRYVFVVGAVERQDYWPVAVTDIRIAALSVKGGVTTWETGPADADALTRYRRSAETSTAVRFPADHDQFRLVGCDPGVCVEELRSGARWALYLETTATPAPATPSVQSTPAAR